MLNIHVFQAVITVYQNLINLEKFLVMMYDDLHKQVTVQLCEVKNTDKFVQK